MQLFEPLVFQSFWVAGLVLIIVFAGSVVQAGLGMGFGLTVAPLLALIDPVLVPVPALFMGTVTAVLGSLNEPRNIVWPEVGVGMLGRFSGIVAGAFLLISLTSKSTFLLVFGVIILCAVILSIMGWRLAFTMRNLFAMGIVSGFTGVVTSVGAPPLALIYQDKPAEQTRATLATFFAIGGATSLLILFAIGWAKVDHIYMALFMAPAAAFGTWYGQKIRGRFVSKYRGFLLGVAGFASIMLILKGLS